MWSSLGIISKNPLTPKIMFHYISNLFSMFREFWIKNEFSWWLQTLQKIPSLQISTLQSKSSPSKIICCHVACLDWTPQTSHLESALKVCNIFFWHKLLAIFIWRFLLPTAETQHPCWNSAWVLFLAYIQVDVHIRISKGNSGKRCPSGVFQKRRRWQKTTHGQGKGYLGSNNLITNLYTPPKTNMSPKNGLFQ